MQWLERLSLRAFRHRLDKRSLQEELDLHRLYLITTYFDKGEGTPPASAARRRAATNVGVVQEADWILMARTRWTQKRGSLASRWVRSNGPPKTIQAARDGA
jgi:hypothetical protein